MGGGVTGAAGREAAPAARVARALAVSGRRMSVLADGSGWGVFSGGDRRRRPVLRVADALARAMASAGAVVEADGGGWVLAEGAEARDAPEAPRTALSLVAAGAPRSRLRGPGFAGLALRAERGEGQLSVREAAAGRRLIADAEASLRMPGLSMNWDAVPADRARAGPAAGAPRGGGALAAARRLERIEADIGERAWRLCWAACVEGLPLAALERRCGLAKRSAARRLSEALEKLAGAYGKVG